MQSDSDPPVCSSQALWAQVDDLEGLDFSVLDGDAIIDTQGDGPESFSQESSFSIESDLEQAMVLFAEAESKTNVPVEPTSSASSSTTVVTMSGSTNVINSTSEVASNSTTPKASQSTPTLGKRSASNFSFTKNPRASKAAKTDDTLHIPVVVAFSRSVQKWIDSKNLPWGVQWEIARLVSNKSFNYGDVKLSYLDEFENKNNAKAAPMVERTLLGKITEEGNGNSLFENERKAKFPYTELDLEDELLENDILAGLGFGENSDWFGGKVVFRGKVENFAAEKDSPQFRIRLEKAELGASSRFSRRFGSKSFVRIKIPKALWKYSVALVDFFRRPFIVSGKVFRAFLEKEKNVFLFMTNEVAESELEIQKVPGRLSLEAFLNWHNPLDLNQQQSVAKYASRFALGLSTSAPGLIIKPENINFIDDIVSQAGSDMTDGAGFINRAALRQLQNKFNWEVWPTAIQCRIAGAKGMLLQDPKDNETEPKVYIRGSMTKIKYPDLSSDPALCIIDVLRSCHPRYNCALSSETIINLAENRVPRQVLTKLLDNTLDALIASLTTWDTQEDLEELWTTLARLGGVFAARSARRKAGLARVHGYSERDAQQEEDEDGLDDADEGERSTAWWDDEVSGQPSSLEETVMRLLDAGFTPKDCPVMLDKLKHILLKQIDLSTSRFHLEVPMSFTAFILPDPEGILEEGEIFFKSSQRGILTKDGQETDVLTGWVIVTRHPCKLPTDAQKWMAVDRPELRHYTDVILISVKGARRGADWLGGGDYDGDKALAIYQPEVVEFFKNADPNLGDPRVGDALKTSYFSLHTETVNELLARVPDAPTTNPLARVHALQEYLIGGIKTASLVGQASNMHDCLLYERGLNDPETIRLAHIFCHTLDGTKTGLRARPELWKCDTKRFDKGTMHWKVSEKIKGKRSISAVSTSNVLSERRKGLGPFIMDLLMIHAKKKGDEEKAKIEKFQVRKNGDVPCDEDLSAPWEEAEKKAVESATQGNNILQEDLAKIVAHVKFVRSRWETSRQRAIEDNKVQRFTDIPIERRQDVLRSVSREFASGPDEAGMLMLHDQIVRLKASYAYIYDFNTDRRKWSRFPWDCSMRELAEIKAKSTGRSRTVKGDFYEKLALKKNRR